MKLCHCEWLKCNELFPNLMGFWVPQDGLLTTIHRLQHYEIRVLSQDGLSPPCDCVTDAASLASGDATWGESRTTAAGCSRQMWLADFKSVRWPEPLKMPIDKPSEWVVKVKYVWNMKWCILIMWPSLLRARNDLICIYARINQQLNVSSHPVSWESKSIWESRMGSIWARSARWKNMSWWRLSMAL